VSTPRRDYSEKFGGARIGAGRPRGTTGILWSATLEKREAREAVRKFVTQNLGVLLQAQLHNAIGLSHLMLRDEKTGQFTRVTGDADQVDQAVKSKNAIWIYTKDPNVQAFSDLLNRALDKPGEHVEISGADGGPIQIQWLTPELNSSVVNVTPTEVKEQKPKPQALLQSSSSVQVKKKKLSKKKNA
jgi:hypothetical protein